MARLRARAERCPRVAVLGEFSAGKSTLVNALVGHPIAPTRVTATQAAPLWISQGAERRAEVVGRDGGRSLIDPGAVRDVDAATTRLVRLRLPAAGLARFDVIDTPGSLDPLLSEEMLERARGLADMAIWCTSAVQAWRRSEAAAWSALPERLRRRGVLVVTHADRLGEADLARVMTRLERETEGRFRERLAISASRAAEASAGGDEGAWIAAGGTRLRSVLDRLAEEIRLGLRAPLARYALRPGAEEKPAPAAAAPPRPRPVAQSSSSALDAFDAAAARLPDEPSPGDLAELARDVVGAAGRDAVWRRLLLAHRFEATEPARLLRQMRGEVVDFAEGSWGELAPATDPGPADRA